MTAPQREVLEYIIAWRKRRPYPPTHTQIAMGTGFVRTAVVSIVHSLQRDGYVTWVPGKGRTLRVLKEPPPL